MSGWLRGTVKEVPTGDTLVITGNAKTWPPPEKRISLSSLLAPKLGRRDGTTKDEPFAWDSREFLRKKCIGQPCVFKIDYTVDAISRDFGSVFLGQTDNVAMAVAANGWAKVRTSQGQQSPYIEDLKKAEEQAQLGGKGVFNKDPAASKASIRDVSDTESSNFNASAFVQSVGKGKALTAIVEQVLNGGSLRVLLLQDMRYATVVMAGIQAPSMGRRPAAPAAGSAAAPAAPPAAAAAAPAPAPAAAAAAGENGHSDEAAENGAGGADGAPAAAAATAAAPSSGVPSTASMLAAGGQQGPEPFAREAKHMTESRLLNREVTVVLEGVDKFSNLFASVLIEGEGGVKENAAEGLLKAGMAKTVEWSLNMLMNGAQKLRELERAAKAAKVGMWANYVPAATNQTKLADNFSGRVAEVVSGDCLVVREDGTRVERRINLSSLRTPRMGTRDRQPEPWAQDAREFLRKKLIGKPVDVQLEYVRKVPAPETGGEREMMFGNVELKAEKGEEKQNVAEMIVARGFATLVRHRADEERSSIYERLGEVEEIAKSSKKGMHSGKEAPGSNRVNDVSAPGQASRAKQYLPFFQRAGKMPAIVDFVLSGHRVKLNIPKESVQIVFAPSGIRTPARAMPAGNGKPAQQAEPFADEAVAFTREFVMQRDVEVVVESIDRGGTFLGSLVIPSHSGRPWNLATELLKVGLARIQPYMDPARLPVEMQQAQEAAKAARLKIWQNWTPEQDEDAEDDEEGGGGGGTLAGLVANGSGAAARAGGSGRGPEVLEVTVTEVASAQEFYVQIVGEPRVQWIAEQLAAMSLAETVIAPENVRAGSLVLAQFSLDNQWYRGYVEKVNNRDGTYDIFFIDFGNRESVTSKRIKPMDAALAAVPGQANHATLAYLKLPAPNSEYSGDARALLSELLGGGRKLLASVVARERAVEPLSKNPKLSRPRLVLTVVDPEDNTDVAVQLLEAGLARLPKLKKLPTQAAKDAVQALEQHLETARTYHRGMFQYGDPEESDDETAEIERRIAAAARRR